MDFELLVLFYYFMFFFLGLLFMACLDHLELDLSL